jgi:repressor LexA
MLTRKQHELLLFIHKRLSADGVSPSFDEMKEALGLASKSGVHRLVSALEERGFIRRLPHRARALEVLKLPGGQSLEADVTPDAGDNVVSAPFGRREEPVEENGIEVPVLGRIAAGVPIEAIQHETDRLSVPANMIAGRRAFRSRGQWRLDDRERHPGRRSGDHQTRRHRHHRRYRRRPRP